MNEVLRSLLVGSLGGPIGGVLAAALGATVLRRVSERVHAALLALAGGFILSVAHLELLGHALEEADAVVVALAAAGFAVGALARGAVHRIVHPKHPEARDYGVTQARRIALSLAVVNLLEGVPIGAGFAVAAGLGFLLAGIMVFENFMEGISVSTELASARSSRWLAWVLPVAPTVTLGLGAAAGAWLGTLSERLLPAVLGAGAGVMVYVVVDDILYDAQRAGRGAVTTGPLLVGVLAGILLVGLRP